jgi:hypothetical protein
MTDTVNALKTAQRIVKMLDSERNYLNELVWAPVLLQEQIDQSIKQGWKLSSEVLTQWETVGRQVLTIHPELVEAIQFSSSSKIVPEVFRTLPYINPMIVFPDALKLFSHTKGEQMRMLGFICYGKTSRLPERIVDTHDPEATSLCAEIIIEITGAGQVEFEVDYISFPMDGKPYTLSEAVEGVLSRFSWQHGEQNEKVKKRFMRELIKLVIGSLMYLCSTTLEAEKVPRKTVLKSMNPIPRKPFSFYRVGWGIGAALSRSRANIELEGPTAPGKPGFEQDPQHRKAHFKVVWTGPGSMIPKTVFVAPYWTHLEKLGVAGVNTVRRVSI